MVAIDSVSSAMPYESTYALGKDEWERLNDVRNARN